MESYNQNFAIDRVQFNFPVSYPCVDTTRNVPYHLNLKFDYYIHKHDQFDNSDSLFKASHRWDIPSPGLTPLN